MQTAISTPRRLRRLLQQPLPLRRVARVRVPRGSGGALGSLQHRGVVLQRRLVLVKIVLVRPLLLLVVVLSPKASRARTGPGPSVAASATLRPALQPRWRRRAPPAGRLLATELRPRALLRQRKREAREVSVSTHARKRNPGSTPLGGSLPLPTL